MPLKNFINIGTLQSYEYLIGKITEVDVDNDTCDLTIGEDSYSAVPIFFHCSPESEERANGALLGAAKAFREDDEVVVLVLRGEEVPENEKARMYVIALTDSKRYCSGLIVIVSTWSGNEAFAWDIINNKIFIEKTTFTAINDKFKGNTTLLEPTGVEYDDWEDIPFPSSEEYFSIHNSVGNLPLLLYGNWAEPYDGLGLFSTVPFPSAIYYHPFWSWITDVYIDQYYIENPFIPEADRINDRRSPYMILLEGISDNDTKEEFEELTGCEWFPDVDESATNPVRQMMFWHTTFGYPMKDEYSIRDNLEATMELFYDEWADSVYTPVPDEVCEVAPCMSAFKFGIASIEKKRASEEEEPVIEKAVIFEYFGMCVDWESNQCVNSEDNFKQIIRIYARDDSYISGLAKECFDAVNNERVKPLGVNLALMKAAKRHLDDMMANATIDTVSHTGTDGTSQQDRAIEENYTLWVHEGESFEVSENIAAFNVGLLDETGLTPSQQAVEGWRNSSGHWSNLTRADWLDTGIAVGIVPAVPATETSPEIPAWYLFVQVFGYRQEHWGGFTAIDTTDLEQYMKDNFNYTDSADKSRLHKLYLTNGE